VKRLLASVLRGTDIGRVAVRSVQFDH
jgi:hypothetical protein